VISKKAPPETPPVWIGKSWEQVRPTGKHCIWLWLT
jgi:hypothetical protein